MSKDIVSLLESSITGFIDIEIPKLITKITKENKITKEKYILVLGLNLLLLLSLRVL